MKSRSNRALLFLLFFASGFCSLLYQVIWTRMAFASFGIITPVLSVIISVFMLGLALGSWGTGRWIDTFPRFSPIFFYALAELTIGIGAFAVPRLFALGERLLLSSGESNSGRYLFLSAIVLAISILPWCVFMGATFPCMMAYLRRRETQSTESFSYLYLANVLGAMTGTLLTALVFIESLGFRHTLWVAAAGNFIIAAISGVLGFRDRSDASQKEEMRAVQNSPSSLTFLPSTLLFATGFIAMAMEVVWIRSFAPVIKTQVYSFSLVLATYLGATFAGSLWYRRHLNQNSTFKTQTLIGALAVAAFIPIIVNDPRLVRANGDWYSDPLSIGFLLASICPFCALLGYLTPSLIDESSAGAPAIAGRAYALNVLGCILGPLFASYILLPWIRDRYCLILLSLPFLAILFLPPRREVGSGVGEVAIKAQKSKIKNSWAWAVASIAALLVSSFLSGSYEDYVLRHEPHSTVRRDYAASVLSFGGGMQKRLLVNGIGMTSLTAITKFMVHLPLAFHKEPPKNALIICFGMGTTYRAALSWGIDVTAVELVPGVRDAFTFYHADAAEVLSNPKGRIIVDDGRRFLKRTREKYDVIVIDPPPPPEAAGSSLLYSEEFYALAKEHLNPGGILQAWVPDDNADTIHASSRSVNNSFPYVRCFDSVAGWGFHLLASREPIESRTAAALESLLPEKAKQDLLEWERPDPPDASGGTATPPDQKSKREQQKCASFLGLVISNEPPIDTLMGTDESVRVTDDHPYNEYFLLRHYLF